MKIIEPSVEILYPSNQNEWEREFKLMEVQCRTAYKSEDKITDISYLSFLQGIKKRNHGAAIEFGNLVFKVITNRGVTHELVRHRIASFLQESTRYCNYGADKFGKEITFIRPSKWNTWNDQVKNTWLNTMQTLEETYLQLVTINNLSPQEARGILPNDLKTEIVVKMNFREVLHFLDLRYHGKTGTPHPDMKQVSTLLYNTLVENAGFLFKE